MCTFSNTYYNSNTYNSQAHGNKYIIRFKCVRFHRYVQLLAQKTQAKESRPARTKNLYGTNLFFEYDFLFLSSTTALRSIIIELQ